MKFLKNLSKVFYFLTPFLLIPLIGGIFGFVFVLFSLFCYRDRFVLISGCIGITISIIYGCIFGFSLRGGELSRKAVKILSVKYMDEISGYLEIYKKKYNVYPDSLSELKKLSNAISLYDPVADYIRRKPTEFNYKRSSNTYILFSSGLDTIPGTKDDLYSNFSK